MRKCKYLSLFLFAFCIPLIIAETHQASICLWYEDGMIIKLVFFNKDGDVVQQSNEIEVQKNIYKLDLENSQYYLAYACKNRGEPEFNKYVFFSTPVMIGNGGNIVDDKKSPVVIPEGDDPKLDRTTPFPPKHCLQKAQKILLRPKGVPDGLPVRDLKIGTSLDCEGKYTGNIQKMIVKDLNQQYRQEGKDLVIPIQYSGISGVTLKKGANQRYMENLSIDIAGKNESEIVSEFTLQKQLLIMVDQELGPNENQKLFNCIPKAIPDMKGLADMKNCPHVSIWFFSSAEQPYKYKNIRATWKDTKNEMWKIKATKQGQTKLEEYLQPVSDLLVNDGYAPQPLILLITEGQETKFFDSDGRLKDFDIAGKKKHFEETKTWLAVIQIKNDDLESITPLYSRFDFKEDDSAARLTENIKKAIQFRLDNLDLGYEEEKK